MTKLSAVGVRFDFAERLLRVAVLLDRGTVLIQPVAGRLKSPGFAISGVCMLLIVVVVPKSRSKNNNNDVCLPN